MLFGPTQCRCRFALDHLLYDGSCDQSLACSEVVGSGAPVLIIPIRPKRCQSLDTTATGLLPPTAAEMSSAPPRVLWMCSIAAQLRLRRSSRTMESACEVRSQPLAIACSIHLCQWH